MSKCVVLSKYKLTNVVNLNLKFTEDFLHLFFPPNVSRMNMLARGLIWQKGYRVRRGLFYASKAFFILGNDLNLMGSLI